MNKQPYSKKNAKVIAQLWDSVPSELMKAFVDTVDQAQEWTEHRGRYKALAAIWRSRFLGEDDPIEAACQEHKIDVLVRDYYQALCDWYEDLWVLVQLCHPDVKKRFGNEYPFPKAINLFEEIIRYEADKNFSACLNPYVEFRVSDVKALSEVVLETSSLSLLEAESREGIGRLFVAYNLCAQSTPSPWAVMVLAIALSKSKRSPAVRRRFRHLESTMVELAELARKAAGKKASSTWDAYRSVVWHKGKRLEADSHGFYRP